MLRFRRIRTLQKGADLPASVRNDFPTERYLPNRDTSKQARAGSLGPNGVAFSLPDTWVGKGCRRLVRTSLSTPAGALEAGMTNSSSGYLPMKSPSD